MRALKWLVGAMTVVACVVATAAAGAATLGAGAADDTAAPATVAVLDPADPGAGGTYDGPVTVTLSAADEDAGSGVAKTEYRIDGGDWTTYNELPSTPPAEEVIFDGTQASLDKWVQAGPGGFDLQPDGSIQAHGGLGMLWYPVTQYQDFSLKLQFRDARTDGGFANSGAFVRFPDPRAGQQPACGTGQSEPWVAIFCGQEIQMYDGSTGEPQKTGSVYNFDPLTLEQAHAPAQGDWSDYEIRVVGQNYTIVRDGQTINTFANTPGQQSSRDGDPPTDERQFSRGYIGLQNHSDADKIQIRDVRVTDLSGSGTGPFTVSDAGDHAIEFRSTDVAGNVEQDKTVEFSISDAAPEPENVFITIGITRAATKQNAGIRGGWSLRAEEMPTSRAVVTPPADTADDVAVRMPNTSGTVANLAAFRGQTVVLTDAEQGAYSKIHFFGTTSDGGPAGGDFVLHYSDGSAQSIQVRFPDWCAQPAGNAHWAIGPLGGRHTAGGGDDGARCGIFHVPGDADGAKTLASVTLPSSTTGNAGGQTQAYLMALTLEKADGTFVTPDLGASPFPDDLTAPESTGALDPAAPQGQNGWYSSDVTVTLDATDTGGAGVEKIEYSVDGAAFGAYDAPFTVSGEGRHTVDYRAVDRAGNVETPHSAPVNIDATPPVSEPVLAPRRATANGWYDTPVTLTLRGSDGNGSGIVKREYRVGSGPWTTYTAPVAFSAAGRYSVAARATDGAGYVETPAAPVTFNVDGTAPVTSALIDGASPAQNYAAPVQVALHGADGAGAGVARTEYSVDGGAWRPYAGAFTVTGSGVHIVDYRSSDAAGNLENIREAVFRITLGTQGGGGGVTPEPEPWAGVVKPPRARSTVAALRRGKLVVGVRCLAVSRGTLRLVVSRATAKRLHLKSRTLASRSFRCQDDGRVDVRLKPKSKVRRALARHLKHRSLHAVLSVRAVGAQGSATASRKVVLRGR